MFDNKLSYNVDQRSDTTTTEKVRARNNINAATIKEWSSTPHGEHTVTQQESEQGFFHLTPTYYDSYKGKICLVNLQLRTENAMQGGDIIPVFVTVAYSSDLGSAVSNPFVGVLARLNSNHFFSCCFSHATNNWSNVVYRIRFKENSIPAGTVLDWLFDISVIDGNVDL